MRPDEFVELQMNLTGVPVLSVLNQEHHQESHDGGSRIYDQLPGIGIAKVWTGHEPDRDNDNRRQEGGRRARPFGCRVRKSSERLPGLFVEDAIRSCFHRLSSPGDMCLYVELFTNSAPNVTRIFVDGRRWLRSSA